MDNRTDNKMQSNKPKIRISGRARQRLTKILEILLDLGIGKEFTLSDLKKALEDRYALKNPTPSDSENNLDYLVKLGLVKRKNRGYKILDTMSLIKEVPPDVLSCIIPIAIEEKDMIQYFGKFSQLPKLQGEVDEIEYRGKYGEYFAPFRFEYKTTGAIYRYNDVYWSDIPNLSKFSGTINDTNVDDLVSEVIGIFSNTGDESELGGNKINDRIVVIQGIDGIGKTSLLKAICHNYYSSNRLPFFLDQTDLGENPKELIERIIEDISNNYYGDIIPLITIDNCEDEIISTIEEIDSDQVRYAITLRGDPINDASDKYTSLSIDSSSTMHNYSIRLFSSISGSNQDHRYVKLLSHILTRIAKEDFWMFKLSVRSLIKFVTDRYVDVIYPNESIISLDKKDSILTEILQMPRNIARIKIQSEIHSILEESITRISLNHDLTKLDLLKWIHLIILLLQLLGELPVKRIKDVMNDLKLPKKVLSDLEEIGLIRVIEDMVVLRHPSSLSMILETFSNRFIHDFDSQLFYEENPNSKIFLNVWKWYSDNIETLYTFAKIRADITSQYNSNQHSCINLTRIELSPDFIMDLLSIFPPSEKIEELSRLNIHHLSTLVDDPIFEEVTNYINPIQVIPDWFHTVLNSPQLIEDFDKLVRAIELDYPSKVKLKERFQTLLEDQEMVDRIISLAFHLEPFLNSVIPFKGTEFLLQRCSSISNFLKYTSGDLRPPILHMYGFEFRTKLATPSFIDLEKVLISNLSADYYFEKIINESWFDREKALYLRDKLLEYNYTVLLEINNSLPVNEINQIIPQIDDGRISLYSFNEWIERVEGYRTKYLVFDPILSDFNVQSLVSYYRMMDNNLKGALLEKIGYPSILEKFIDYLPEDEIPELIDLLSEKYSLREIITTTSSKKFIEIVFSTLRDRILDYEIFNLGEAIYKPYIYDTVLDTAQEFGIRSKSISKIQKELVKFIQNEVDQILDNLPLCQDHGGISYLLYRLSRITSLLDNYRYSLGIKDDNSLWSSIRFGRFLYHKSLEISSLEPQDVDWEYLEVLKEKNIGLFVSSVCRLSGLANKIISSKARELLLSLSDQTNFGLSDLDWSVYESMLDHESIIQATIDAYLPLSLLLEYLENVPIRKLDQDAIDNINQLEKNETDGKRLEVVYLHWALLHKYQVNELLFLTLDEAISFITSHLDGTADNLPSSLIGRGTFGNYYMDLAKFPEKLRIEVVKRAISLFDEGNDVLVSVIINSPLGLHKILAQRPNLDLFLELLLINPTSLWTTEVLKSIWLYLIKVKDEFLDRLIAPQEYDSQLVLYQIIDSTMENEELRPLVVDFITHLDFFKLMAALRGNYGQIILWGMEKISKNQVRNIVGDNDLSNYSFILPDLALKILSLE